MATTASRPMHAPPIPADATFFAFAPGATWVTFFAILMAAAEATLLLVQAWFTVDPTTRITQIPLGVFFLLVADLNWRLFRRSRDRVAVNSHGIWSVRRGGATYLDWGGIAKVKADDARQRLELVDSSGAAAIRVEYELTNFATLRDFILAHAAKSAPVETYGATTFHRSWNTKTILVVAAALLFFIAWRMHAHGPAQQYMVLAAFGAVALILTSFDPVSVTIDRDGIAIGYVGYQRRVLFSSIIEVSISDVKSRQNIVTGVVIHRQRGAPIRLFRIREGFVALYEALQSALQSARQTAGTTAVVSQPLPQMQTASDRELARVTAGPRTANMIGAAFGLIFFTALAMFATLHRGNLGEMIDDLFAYRWSWRPIYQMHRGPVAKLSELEGSGRIYLVQMGEHKAPYSLDDFAKRLRAKYGLDVQVLPAMAVDASAWDRKRRQFVAEQLFEQIKQGHPDLAADHDAYLIGFTDGNMYSTKEMWSGTFTERDRARTAIISADQMGDTEWQQKHLSPDGAVERFQARLRRILLKDIAVLYWHLQINDDASSLLNNILDPDLPEEDIFESDVNSVLSPKGQKLYEPCIFFTYFAKEGMRRLPGPIIQNCTQVQDPMEDEAVELFELDLRLGLLIDKHTDLYLPDTIPIEFQRVLRDGTPVERSFGVSGLDNYDEFLGSADNILVFVERADGGTDNLMRVPKWLPVLPLVKYVGGESKWTVTPGFRGSLYKRIWQYEMAWHRLPFEHYDVRRFNGGVKTYLPCDDPSVNCFLVGYKDSQGRELKIERDENRHLKRLTSPSGNWVGVGNGPEGRITAILDNKMRSVLYGYDDRNRLNRVTYPSGAIYSYEYDDTQHMLTFSVAADANAEPSTMLRMEYQDGLLTKITLANGDVYTCACDSRDPNAIHHATVDAPKGQRFDLDITYDFSIVREHLDEPRSIAAKPAH